MTLSDRRLAELNHLPDPTVRELLREIANLRAQVLAARSIVRAWNGMGMRPASSLGPAGSFIGPPAVGYEHNTGFILVDRSRQRDFLHAVRVWERLEKHLAERAAQVREVAT